MEIPTSLIETTEKVGNDINLVQGPGGNISYKENGFMYIKASGKKMSDVKKKNIFLKTNHGKIISALKKLNLHAEECWMIGDNLISDILGGNNFGLTTLHKYANKKDIKYKNIFPDANFNDFSSLYNLINEII